MSRYIDAEWLIKELMQLSFLVQKWVNEVQIMTAPSIDIVRCRECKYRKHRVDFQNDYCIQHSKVLYSTDGYCSWGERSSE